MKRALLRLSLILILGCGFSKVYAQKSLEECSGGLGTLNGDALAVTADDFEWQYSADNAATWSKYEYGTFVTADYQNFSFDNSTKADLFYKFRRRITISSVVKYDSFYNLTVHPAIDKFGIAAYRPLICAGNNDPVTFTGDKPEGYSTNPQYQWQQSFNNIDWTPAPNGITQNLTYSVADLRPINLRRITTINNCSAISNIVTLTPLAATTVSVAGADQVACNQSEFTLNANPAAVTETGTWTSLSQDFDPFDENNRHNPLLKVTGVPQNVDIKLKWTIKNLCLQESSSITTIRSNKPPVVDAGPDVVVDKGKGIILNAKVDNTGNYTFEWSPATGLNDVHALNPVASPLQTTTYTLTVTSASGCIKADQATVNVNILLGIPNAFTPNSDGVNDTWNIRNIEIYPHAKITVYNRQGEAVFQSVGYPMPWNGTYKGKRLPAGVYYYAIVNEESKFKQGGSVMIIK